MPPDATVRLWVVDNVQGFAAQYTRARDLGLDVMAEEVLDISDDGRNDWVERETARGTPYVALNEEALGRSRLRVDARKWYLSKLAPKRYGEKQAVELTGADGGPVQISDVERAARLKSLLALAAKRKDEDASDLV